MPKQRTTGRRRSRRKVNGYSEHAPLAALGLVIAEKQIFQPIHQRVLIPQKTVDYRPTDKLVFVTLSILAGSQTVYEINHTLRVDKPLLRAFGYDSCADQSVIQQTLNASTAENVVQLQAAVQQIWRQHNPVASLLQAAAQKQRAVTIDLHLSGMPASARAEGSTKGYFSGKRGIYGRQLARVLSPDTQEIVTESLYPGNTLSCQVFKEMVVKMEQQLVLETKAQRALLRLRLDGGFGTDSNINYALWKGYHILAKMYSGKRARKLAQSVTEWVDAKTTDQKAKDLPPTRQAGWVLTPHRYAIRTRQLAIRTPNPKRKGGWCYRVRVTTEMEAGLSAILQDDDDRGGVPENSFCQSNPGLAQRKRRKHGFVAQQMLTLLSQLAHNLIIWLKGWMTDALEQTPVLTDSDSRALSQPLQRVTTTIAGYGIKRFVRHLLGLSGKVILKGYRIKRLILHCDYPLIQRIIIALASLLKPYRIRIGVSST